MIFLKGSEYRMPRRRKIIKGIVESIVRFVAWFISLLPSRTPCQGAGIVQAHFSCDLLYDPSPSNHSQTGSNSALRLNQRLCEGLLHNEAEEKTINSGRQTHWLWTMDLRKIRKLCSWVVQQALVLAEYSKHKECVYVACNLLWQDKFIK